MVEKYVIVTDDGWAKDVFLSWVDDMGGYYSTVDYIDEICEADRYNSIEEAEARAKDADSGTWGGWNAPMKIMKVLNPEDAFSGEDEPELKLIKTISFNK